jgi:hypothetical protein
MTTKELQSLLKNAVREVFREEFKEILLEAVKNNNTGLVNENRPIPQAPTHIKEDLRQKYGSQFNMNFNTNDIPPLQVNRGYNTVGEGSMLPEGEVSLDQIMNLMNSK